MSLPRTPWRRLRRTLALAGMATVAVGCSIVDETGYGTPDDDLTDPSLGGGLEDGDDAAGDTAPPAADAEASLDADRILHTAAEPLGPTPIEVSLIGLPGALLDPAGTSTVVAQVGDGPVSTATLYDDGFVVRLSASADDVVTLTGGGGEPVEIALAALEAEADLGLPAPDDSGDTGTFDEADALGFPTPVGGEVAVGDGDLAAAPPYVVFHPALGASVDVSVGDVGVTLPAEVGDTLCLAPLGTDGAAGPAVCALL